jgi:cobalt/nickel transport system permease protein
MRHAFLDKWSRIDSPVHRLPASGKLILSLTWVLAAVLAPVRAVWLFVALAAGLLLAAVASRVPLGFLVRRLLLLEPFIAGVALLTLWQPGGVAVALTIVLRSSLCLATMILLTNTTPFSELLRILRRAGLPALLVTTMALMYRYLFVLIEEAERMQRARASRTLRAHRVHAWRSTAALAGQLLLRSTERAERIYAAMCARGWR